MAAVAGVFRQTTTLHYYMKAMSNDDAKILNFLVKDIPERRSRLRGIEEQRMSANSADKLAMIIALSHFCIVMTEKETGESMSDARFRTVSLEKARIASTFPGSALICCEDPIVDMVAE
jgi:hypothetical protein